MGQGLWYTTGMNIFAIESHSGGGIDWRKSALSHDNFRVNKMIIESCQMLSTNAQLLGEQTRYRMSFQNHPSTIWARESSSNFACLAVLAQELRDEFCRRYNRDSHGCDDVIKHMNDLINVDKFIMQFELHEPTELPLCMPDEYKSDNVVNSYRNFFANKPNLRYFEGQAPAWIAEYRTHETPVMFQ
jgi:hypothetical protein